MDEFSEHFLFSDGLYVNYTKRTDFSFFESEKIKIGIIGFCIDAERRAERNRIAEYLANNCSSKDDVLRVSRFFAGRYAILVEDKNGIWIFNDACGYCSVYYDLENICLSSSEALIAKRYGYSVSEEGKNIINNKLDIFQPFPYNITGFTNVKILLPNHVWQIGQNAESVRFFPHPDDSLITMDKNEICEISFKYIDNIFKQYMDYYNLVCDITAGTDSRVNLAFLLNSSKPEQVKTFTSKHSEGKDDDDIIVPRQMSEKLKFQHIVCLNESMPDDYYAQICEYYGDYYPKTLFDSGYTFQKNFGKGYAVLDGNVIGHVAKSYIGKGLSSRHIKANFFVAKQHNFSKETKKYTKQYLKELENAGDLLLHMICSRLKVEMQDGLLVL